MQSSVGDTVVLSTVANGNFSLVTTDAAAAAAHIQITADGTVDIDSAGALTLDSGAAINIEPAANSAILLDGTISIDAGVVTGATSITSTAFVGTIDGVVGGNTPAAITGTTIDATTDFTIGSLVITDDSIVMTPSASDTVTLSANTNGAFSIVTVDAAAAAANFQITADGTVDIDSAGVLTLDSGAAINLEPAAGSAILLDGTISVDAGVVTGATSITSTAFLGTTIGPTNDTDLITLADGSVTIDGDLSFTGIQTISNTSSTFNIVANGELRLESVTTAIIVNSTQTANGDLIIHGQTNASWATFDVSEEDLVFAAATSIKTTAGAITLTPTTDTFFSNGTGVVIGHTAQTNAGAQGYEFQILGTAVPDTGMILGAFTGGNVPRFNFLRSRGSSIGASGIVLDDDVLGVLNWWADDGNDHSSYAASISAAIDGTPGENDVPGRLIFSTTADGSASPTERMRIDALGRVFIGDTTIGTSVDMDTPGLVISQAAGDKHILVLKSSDVAHGVTTVAETDTYGAFLKSVAGSGGLSVIGLSEGEVATRFDSIYTTDDTGKAASALSSPVLL